MPTKKKPTKVAKKVAPKKVTAKPAPKTVTKRPKSPPKSLALKGGRRVQTYAAWKRAKLKKLQTRTKKS